jgi:hypothetical protein
MRLKLGGCVCCEANEEQHQKGKESAGWHNCYPLMPDAQYIHQFKKLNLIQRRFAKK